MADEQATEVDTQVDTQANDTQQAEGQEIDYKAEYENTQKLVEKLKADNAGLDRKIGELSNAQKELLKKTETAEETAERERLERVEQEKQERILRDKEKSETLAEINKLKVEREALKLGFTEEEVEMLGFKDVESVTKYKAFLDSKIQSTKEAQTKEIESALSGGRENITGNKSGVSYPNAIEKAFN